MDTLTDQPGSGCEVHPQADTMPSTDLLEEVDFKWLMAGQGCWVDSARIRTDQRYAKLCLDDAHNSPCDALRACASRLQASLSRSFAHLFAQ